MIQMASDMHLVTYTSSAVTKLGISDYTQTILQHVQL